MRTQLILFSLILVLFACSKSEDTNLAPDQPVILTPADGETCESLRPALTWEASDPEEDELSYTVWMGTDENNLLVVSDGLQNTRFTPAENLLTSTKYFWQVEAHDGSESTKSEIVSFGTKGEGESGVLPSKPLIIAPKNDVGAGDITFTWNASINGVGTITYDLYVKHGAATEFTLLEGGIDGTSHTSNITAGSLSWYAEARDSRGQTSRSSVITISIN